MKWIKLEARRFGPLEDWSARLEKQTVVFFGRNEAGKSTMKELMCTLLFGSPKKRGTLKELIRWGAEDARLEGTLQQEDGTAVTLQRTLRPNRVTGSLLVNGRETPLGEDPLPLLTPVDQGLYRSIYALSLADLLFPKQEAWALIQDQLLGDAGHSLRPASQVRETLYREAMATWRPDRRGKTRMEGLAAQLKEKYDALHAAARAGEEAQALAREQEEEQETLRQLREEQETLARRLEEARSQLARLARRSEGLALLRQAGNVEIFDALPEDTPAALENARREQRRLAAVTAETAQALARRQEEARALTPEDEALLTREGEIARLLAQKDAIAEAEARLPQWAREIRKKRENALALADQEMGVYIHDDPALEPDTLLPLARRATESRARFLRAEGALAESRRQNRSPVTRILGWVALGLAALALALFLVPRTHPFPAPWDRLAWILPGGIAAAVGLLALPLGRMILRRRTADLRAEDREARREQTEAQTALLRSLEHLPFQKDRLEHPGALAEAAEAYATLALETRQEDDRYRAVEQEQATRTAELAALARELLPDPELPPIETLEALAAALEEARQHREISRAAQENIPELRGKLEEAKRRQQQAVDAESAIGDLLYGVPGDTVADQVAEIRRRRQLAHRGAALLDAPEDRDLPSQEEAEAAVARLADRQRALAEELETLHSRQGARAQRKAALEAEAVTAPLLNEVRALEAEQERMARERDENAVLYGLLKLAEQRFREEHQPDVVRRASSYLSQITSGRYSRIVIGDDQKSIRLFSPEAGVFLDPAAARLSQGTTEQVFLSLRLGLVDHLDPQGETLPLLLDETFVNWDHDRLVRGLAVLQQAASHRQLILFTCHPWMLEALTEAGCDYQLVDMEGAHV